MIRSSKHSIKSANAGKISKFNAFRSEWERVGRIFLDSIWDNGYESFKVGKDQLNLPLFLDYRKFNLNTTLSARALRSLIDAIRDLIAGTVEKRKKIIFGLDKNNCDLKIKTKTLRKFTIQKPSLVNLNIRLDSNCSDISQGVNFIFVQLKSLGKSFGKIRIPVKPTFVSGKWASKGRLMSGIEISTDYIRFSYEIEPENTKQKQIVGCDTGIKTTAAFSDGQKTPDSDIHGHTFDSILDKIGRKKKGSKAFERASEHRKNFINWSLNQVDFGKFGEIRLEKIHNFGFKKRVKKKFRSWCNTLIRDKIKSRAEELGVQVIEQDSSYRSQRCSGCGLVRKANRKGKFYKCKNCQLELDSDFNASLNHSVDLPDIGWQFRGKGYNKKDGFFWKPDGLFTFVGRELIVPSCSKNDILL